MRIEDQPKPAPAMRISGFRQSLSSLVRTPGLMPWSVCSFSDLAFPATNGNPTPLCVTPSFKRFQGHGIDPLCRPKLKLGQLAQLPIKTPPRRGKLVVNVEFMIRSSRRVRLQRPPRPTVDQVGNRRLKRLPISRLSLRQPAALYQRVDHIWSEFVPHQAHASPPATAVLTLSLGFRRWEGAGRHSPAFIPRKASGNPRP